MIDKSVIILYERGPDFPNKKALCMQLADHDCFIIFKNLCCYFGFDKAKPIICPHSAHKDH